MVSNGFRTNFVIISTSSSEIIIVIRNDYESTKEENDTSEIISMCDIKLHIFIVQIDYKFS